MTPKQKTIETIARQHLRIKTLAERKSDSLDFHEVAVWSVEKALVAAYDAGQAKCNASLEDTVRENLSPEAAAAIAAYLQPVKTNDPKVTREVRWFSDVIRETIGTDQCNRLCEQLGL